MQKVSLHSHTNFSDGKQTPLQVLETAERLKTIVGITDHNVITAIRELMKQSIQDRSLQTRIQRHLIPGVELQSREGAELLVYGLTNQHLDDFYREEIEEPRLLHPTNPVFEPVNISISDLINRCKDWEMEIVVPHYGLRHYGIGRLPSELRKQVVYQLRRYREHVCVERNPHVSVFKNVQAITFAKSRKNQFPVIATADDHLGLHSSYTTVDLSNDTEEACRAQEVFAALHQNPPAWKDQHLEHTNAIASMRMLWNMGFKGFTSFVKQEARYLFGSSNSVQPHSKTHRTADVVGVDDF